MLKNTNLQELAAAIADTVEAVPAGGTTVAGSAVLSISLLELVIDVSRAETASAKTVFINAKKRLKKNKEKLFKAVDDDAAAYLKNQKSNFKNLKDLIEIIAVPLDIALSCYDSLLITEEIKEKIKTAVQADYEISRYNLKAAVKGAIAIIEANYHFFPAENEYLLKVKTEVEEMKSGLNKF